MHPEADTAAGLHGKQKCSMLGPGMTAQSTQLVRLDTNGPPDGSRRPLFGLNAEALGACLVEMGEPKWRGCQISEAIYQQRVIDVSEITTLSKSLRQKLTAEGWEVARPRIAQTFTSIDGTERYLVQGQSPDVQTVEAVWMPEGDGGEAGDGTDSASPAMNAKAASGEPEKSWSRATICVSSQVGCAVNCQFCLTAKLGLQRNLSAGEIAGQVRRGPRSPQRRGGPRPREPGLHGHGRAVPQLRQLHGRGAPAGRRGRPEPAAHDGVDLGHCSRHRALCRRSRRSCAPSSPSA